MPSHTREDRYVGGHRAEEKPSRWRIWLDRLVARLRTA